MLRNLKKNQSGFTIIEVLIVLAIAGLIMVAVFTAVPALQRSSRNNDRKSSSSQVIASISSYVANNNGVLPVAGTLANAVLDYKPGFFTVASIFYGTSASIPVAVTSGGTGSSTILTTDNVIFISGVVCNATNTGASATGVSSRSYVVLYGVETGAGGTIQCIGS